MRALFCTLLTLFAVSAQAQFRVIENQVIFGSEAATSVKTPAEGLWSIATGWNNNKPTDWHNVSPQRIETVGEYTILHGELNTDKGKMVFRDAYKVLPDGVVKCVRRYEWQGSDTLKYVTLSVRLQVVGEQMQAFLPGILYYGNKNGASINPNIIPVYNGKNGEFALFEEHRYPMPFAMVENASSKFATALHTTPSPIRGAERGDQWWSMGVEAKDGYSELVLYSGVIGYNGQYGVVKALQTSPMKYENAYITMEPGRIVEKEFYVETYPITESGTGFQQPIHTSINLYKPFDAERYPLYDDIIRSKYNFAKTRYYEDETSDENGFLFVNFDWCTNSVMGWCGQSDSPGYSFQLLGKRMGDQARALEIVQKSLDFLSKYPTDEQTGLFKLSYDYTKKSYSDSDPVSCGQAMYNFAKAIESGRKNKKLDTHAWEAFLQRACDGAASRILDENWNPRSTAEGFFIAPLAISSKLFKNDRYKQAALKAADLYVKRHYNTVSYWGGTLDATCEDKEGAWAAFQGFITIYEQFGDKSYLKYAKHAMDVCLSYAYVWDVSLPAGRMADHNFKTTGWTCVSPQNQHIDIYGVLFSPEIYKMGVYLKDENLKRFAKVMYRTCFQLTDPYGSQGEQLQQTNFAQHGDMSDVYKLRGGYAEKWTVFWITAHFLNAAARFEEIGVEL